MKQIIIVRRDLAMKRGKLAAQACHASLGAYLECSTNSRAGWPTYMNKWMATGMKKVVVYCDNEWELFDLWEKAKRAQLPSYFVRDAGLTTFKEPTNTTLAIGPAPEGEIDTITGRLKLL